MTKKRKGKGYTIAIIIIIHRLVGVIVIIVIIVSNVEPTTITSLLSTISHQIIENNVI